VALARKCAGAGPERVFVGSVGAARNGVAPRFLPERRTRCPGARRAAGFEHERLKKLGREAVETVDVVAEAVSAGAPVVSSWMQLRAVSDATSLPASPGEQHLEFADARQNLEKREDSAAIASLARLTPPRLPRQYPLVPTLPSPLPP